MEGVGVDKEYDQRVKAFTGFGRMNKMLVYEKNGEERVMYHHGVSSMEQGVFLREHKFFVPF